MDEQDLDSNLLSNVAFHYNCFLLGGEKIFDKNKNKNKKPKSYCYEATKFVKKILDENDLKLRWEWRAQRWSFYKKDDDVYIKQVKDDDHLNYITKVDVMTNDEHIGQFKMINVLKKSMDVDEVLDLNKLQTN